MSSNELQAFTPLVELISRVISTVGFPILMTLYFLWSFPRQLDKMHQENRADLKSAMEEIKGLRSDVQELNKLLDYQNRLRAYMMNRESRTEVTPPHDELGGSHAR